MSEALRAAARAVLQLNDLGAWTKPAPRLYPHQWSWDSAFIAIGLAHDDPSRALLELETLFEAQWSDGRLPHIVFNPAAQDYFPGPEWWASAASSPSAPRQIATSGLIQPPVHGLALECVYRAAASGGLSSVLARVAALFPRMLAWHHYLATARDRSGTGLLVIYHPWESGTDNSPRWDGALARLEVGALPAYERHDLKHVGDPSERPSHQEYDRYLWLVELLKGAGYDDARIQQHHPFQIGDALMSALFAASSAALVSLGAALDRPVTELDSLRTWCDRSSDAVQRAWDDSLDVALDYDFVLDAPIAVQTCAGLAPIILPSLAAPLVDKVVARLCGPGFAGAASLAYPVVPSTAVNSPGWHPRSYWRGPSWPIANWLFVRGLRTHGRLAEADALQAANLALLDRPGARFAEYFEPHTAEPLGSSDQSWTAAVALDWLALR